MDELWRRLTQPSRRAEGPELVPGDKEGSRLYLEFHDCLDAHKHTVFYGVAAATIPWSYTRKSVGPFALGMMLAVIPDLLYANWRCDDRYRAFVRHCEAVHRELGRRAASGGGEGGSGVGAAPWQPER